MNRILNVIEGGCVFWIFFSKNEHEVFLVQIMEKKRKENSRMKEILYQVKPIKNSLTTTLDKISISCFYLRVNPQMSKVAIWNFKWRTKIKDSHC